MRLYNKSAKQKLALQVLSLSSKGASFRDIAETLQISVGKVEGILDNLNEKAKANLRTVINDKIAIEFEKSILLLEYLLKRTLIIEETSKDERVRLQAISQSAALTSEKNKLLSDAAKISQEIDKTIVIPRRTTSLTVGVIDRDSLNFTANGGR
jgi:DNA-binding CsgD family transcriptional regulator